MERGKYADTLRAVREHARNEAKESNQRFSRKHLKEAVRYFKSNRKESLIDTRSYAGMLAAERQVRVKMGDALWDVFRGPYLYHMGQIEQKLDAAVDELIKRSTEESPQMSVFDVYPRVMQGVRQALLEDQTLQKTFRRRQKLLQESTDFLLTRHQELFETLRMDVESGNVG